MTCLWVLRRDLDALPDRLTESWRLPWIVAPVAGPHGAYSMLLTREDEP
jgi:hypothetical protein